MFQATAAWMVGQVQSLWRQFAQLPGLPFRDVLSAEQVEEVLQPNR